jgi:hypothetical protein
MQSDQILVLQEYLLPTIENSKITKKNIYLLDRDLRLLNDGLNLIKDFLSKANRLKVKD